MRTTTGMALVQICKHNKMVAAHVLAEEDYIGDVLFEFLEITVQDWVTNRWRLEVVPTEEVRTMPICELHSGSTSQDGGRSDRYAEEVKERSPLRTAPIRVESRPEPVLRRLGRWLKGAWLGAAGVIAAEETENTGLHERSSDSYDYPWHAGREP